MIINKLGMASMPSKAALHFNSIRWTRGSPGLGDSLASDAIFIKFLRRFEKLGVAIVEWISDSRRRIVYLKT